MRSRFDISAYLVVGPENTNGRPVPQIIKEAVEAGFTCVQIRSKIASARELIELTRHASDVIAESGRSEEVTLLVDDRLDVVLAARKQGIKVDGIHVGQSDIPVEVCREYLGTSTKPDCGLDLDGKVKIRGFSELAELARLSPIPVVVGGGVKLDDIPQLARTGVDGFFVVSAVAGANDPRSEAIRLVEAWKANKLMKAGVRPDIADYDADPFL